jgi:hypothetical protein
MQTAQGVMASGVAQAGGFTVTPSAAVLNTGLASNYSFSYVASTHTVKPAVDTGRSDSSADLDARALAFRADPLSNVTVAPSLKASQNAYQLTVMKAPQGPQAGLVHIELRSTVGETLIDLPVLVQQWIRAAGPSAVAALPDGLELVDLGGRLALRVLSERLQAGDLVLRSREGELTIRLIKALDRTSSK